MNKQLVVSIAGAATVVASTALVVDYAVRKSKSRANAAELVFGIFGIAAGIAAGVAAVVMAQKEENQALLMEHVLEEDDAALMDENIAEVLGTAVEHTPEAEPLRRTIELDEEASIEDFI
ncbi:MAG: hypothetical protein IJW92_01175 [Clostridia bacterium]|nr:hypothetical protein [Clostridia bacterium]